MINQKGNDCESMFSSIDFFSQNLHVEQIVEYGFSIFNALELPESSAIYVLNNENGCYEVQFNHNYDHKLVLPSIAKDFHHDDFAVRNGFLLIEREVQSRYFEIEFLDAAEVSKIVPLIIDDQLYGFIISVDNDKSESMGFDFLTRFNFLMNLSLEKASRYLERAQLKKEIDKKIFNLNSISQTMRLLLAELDTESIIGLSLDVIREITTSSVTSIGLIDELENQIVLKNYRNLNNDEQVFETFKLCALEEPVHKEMYHIEKDKALLNQIFEDADGFERLSAEYVILLVKDKIIGFVTIGKPLAMLEYEPSLLDRIKDIASIMYIGLKNANQFELINYQKKQLSQQVTVLKNMNKIIKNVNSAESLEELTEMIIETLTLTFGVESGCLITFEDHGYEIKGSVGMEMGQIDPAFVEAIKSKLTDEVLTYYTVEAIEKCPFAPWTSYSNDSNCLIIAPININQFKDEPLGCFLITKTKSRLKESQVSMVDILANSVAPILNQLLSINDYKSNYLPRPEFQIEKLQKRYFNESQMYFMDYFVYVKSLQLLPFEAVDLTDYDSCEVVQLNQMLVIFSNNSLDPKLFDDQTESVNPSFEEIKSLIIMASMK